MKVDLVKHIGFERLHTQVGDSVIAIKGLYALRKLYPKAKITAFVSESAYQLYKTLNVVDEFVIMSKEEALKGRFQEELERRDIDVLLLLHRTSSLIKIAKLAKVKKVITELHMHNLFSLRFKSPMMMISYFVHGSEKILRLVRQINTKYYDSNIKNINFAGGGCKIKPSVQNVAFIDEFLNKIQAKNYQKIIGINPFGSSMNYSFKIQDWLNLAKDLANAFPQNLFIFTSFSANPTKIEDSQIPNIAIFVNNDDLLNLVEIIGRYDLLLSMNTGNIHIADNLRIPTLSLDKTKDKINCIGGSYGGEFISVLLPKNWQENYSKYYEEFYNKAYIWIEKLNKENE